MLLSLAAGAKTSRLAPFMLALQDRLREFRGRNKQEAGHEWQ